MNTSVGECLPAIISSWNFQMLNIMKVPGVEKCPWLVSVATRYSLNVLTRRTEQKETSFMKILPTKHRGGLAGLLPAVIPPKGVVILWRVGDRLPVSPVWAPHRHMLDLGEPPLPCQYPQLELIRVGDSFRWTVRFFFLKRGVKYLTPRITHISGFTTAP